MFELIGILSASAIAGSAIELIRKYIGSRKSHAEEEVHHLRVDVKLPDGSMKLIDLDLSDKDSLRRTLESLPDDYDYEISMRKKK